MDLILFYFFYFIFIILDLDKSVMWERDSIVEEPPSMYIMPTSNLLEVIGLIP